MKHIKNLFPLLGITITIVCCQKSNDAKNNDTSKMSLITRAAWKYEDAGLDANKDGQKDTELPPGFVMPCEKDNLLTFKSDGTGILDEGPTKCDAGNPQTAAFTWSLKNEETIINFSETVFGGIKGDVMLKNITSTRMEIHKEINIGLPQTVNAVVILKH